VSAGEASLEDRRQWSTFETYRGILPPREAHPPRSEGVLEVVLHNERGAPLVSQTAWAHEGARRASSTGSRNDGRQTRVVNPDPAPGEAFLRFAIDSEGSRDFFSSIVGYDKI